MAKKVFKKEKAGGEKKNPFGKKSEDEGGAKKKGDALYDNRRSMKD